MPAQQDLLDRLAAFPATTLPVLSLYLNTEPDQHGKDEIERFLRRELPDRGRTFEPHTPGRESYDRDVERIGRWVSDELRPSSNGVAIFACAGADDFFEAVQLDVPVSEHRLYVYHQPQLYELARLTDAYPRYAAVVADSRLARIFVFALGATVDRAEVENPTDNRTQVGGWSQARYQRHVDHQRQQHARELVDQLDRIVREEGIAHVVLAGDEVIVPVIRAALPQHLEEKVIDVVRLDITTPEHEVLSATLEAMKAEDSREDADQVRRAIDGYRSGGLGVAGLAPTLRALIRGQVSELLLAADFEARHPEPVPRDSDLVPPELAAELGDEVETVDLGAELVTRARNTGAPVSFIEDASLLEQVDGVAGLLRFTL
ncbi:MAG TPA: Vms1/Ankzf1 family peptidyl-tRNA hydrolase [Gemmatimonadales bacterium]